MAGHHQDEPLQRSLCSRRLSHTGTHHWDEPGVSRGLKTAQTTKTQASFSFLWSCPYVLQRHPETRGDVDGSPEKDHDQRSADEGAGAEQERAVRARITAENSVL